MNSIILAVILVRTLTDISFKKAVNDLEFDSVKSIGRNLWALQSNIFWWSGLFFGFANVVLWVASLQKMDLSQAYPFLSLSYVSIILTGKVVFKEHLDRPKLIGMGFIIAGALLLFMG